MKNWLAARWDWGVVVLLALAVSWPYLFGTPYVMGMDYFAHLAHAHSIKVGIEEGNFLPAYTFVHGSGGTPLIRYQALIAAQIMAWLCLLLQKTFALSDTQAIMYTGRVMCTLINLGAGLAFYWGIKKIIPVPMAGLTGTAAYLFGWARVGVLMHVGALERGLGYVVFPLCFSWYLLWWQRTLSRKEQISWGACLAGCLLVHPAIFIFLLILMGVHSLPEVVAKVVVRGRERGDLRQAVYAGGKNLCVPALVTFGLSAWFLIPAIAETSYYGQVRALQTQANPIAATEILSYRYLREFIDRKAWFDNFATAPAEGGSYLGNVTGVSSAYFGISVLVLCLLAGFLPWAHRGYRVIVCKIWGTTLLFLFLIFWEGGRYLVFHSVAHQLFLACRWLEPFYFIVCVLASFGALFLWEFINGRFTDKRWPATAVLALAISFTALDFQILIFTSEARVCYLPQRGKKDPIGLHRNHYVLDSYDVIARCDRQGRVLDVPGANLGCNHLYHRRQNAESFSENRWMENLSYSQMVSGEILRAANFSLEYSNRYDAYPLKGDYFRCDPGIACIGRERVRWQTAPGWEGTTGFHLAFVPPSGNYEAWVVLPVYLPSGAWIQVHGQTETTVSASLPGGENTLLALPFAGRGENPNHVSWQFVLHNPCRERAIKIAHSDRPHVLYRDPTLAYRLALLDIRFLVFNLGHCKAYHLQSQYIRNLHVSSTSLLYENDLSAPYFFPSRTYLVETPRPWEFFNEKICHHPAYNPHLAGFCYEGAPSDFDGSIGESPNWEKEIHSIFSSPRENHPASTARLVKKSLERVEWEIDADKSGFFFPSLAYHPNLKAVLDETNPQRLYLAQAGMMALRLPAGHYRLALYYHHPWYDYLGKYMSLAAAIALFSWQIKRMFHFQTSDIEVRPSRQ